MSNCSVTGSINGTSPNLAPGEATATMDSLYDGLPAGTFYYTGDHLGSSSLVTNANGDEVLRIAYDSYGAVDLAQSGRLENGTLTLATDQAEYGILAVRFTGQEYDDRHGCLSVGGRMDAQEPTPETGFYYYNARFYGPQLGIFTTADTIFDKNAGAFATNRHMYVRGNPITYSDPSGHSLWDDFTDGLSNNWKTITAVATGGFTGVFTGAATVGAANLYVQSQTGQWLNKDQNWSVFGAATQAYAIGAASYASGGWAGGAVSSILGGGFWGSVGAGATSGFTQGFMAGTLSSAAGGSSIDQAISDGLLGGAIGFCAGAIAGGISYEFGNYLQEKANLFASREISATESAQEVVNGSNAAIKLSFAAADIVGEYTAFVSGTTGFLAGVIKSVVTGIRERRSFIETLGNSISNGLVWGFVSGIAGYAIGSSLTLSLAGTGAGSINGLFRANFSASNVNVWAGGIYGLTAGVARAMPYIIPTIYIGGLHD